MVGRSASMSPLGCEPCVRPPVAAIEWRRVGPLVAAMLLHLTLPGWCQEETVGVTCQAPPGGIVQPPAVPPCDNEALTGFDGLLVIAPHPDDEVLGFAGLSAAYRDQGKPVEVIVTTDGDAYCDACRFWKGLSVAGATCDAADLSNFATSEVDSFAEVRHGESRQAAAILGLEPPTFLGYPDTGLAAAWRHAKRGEPDRRLRRSDFSACDDCETCGGGYGAGPVTDLSASSLERALGERIAATSSRTLLATTHWLDGHGDHSALGNFVKTLNDAQDEPRPVVYAVIHAHTPRDSFHSDCWYPAPEAPQCPCALERCAGEDPDWLGSLRRHRLRPSWPAALPGDAPYGSEKQLCLGEELYQGEGALKLKAVRSYGSQLGFSSLSGEEVPGALGGLIDCNGYLIAFVRRTEAFVLHRPAEAAACDPAGVWRGVGESLAGGPDGVAADLTIDLRSGKGRRLEGMISWHDAAGERNEEALTGRLLPGCRVKLRSRGPRRVTYLASVSRDRASLYGSWKGARAGYFVAHR